MDYDSSFDLIMLTPAILGVAALLQLIALVIPSPRGSQKSGASIAFGVLGLVVTVLAAVWRLILAA